MPTIDKPQLRIDADITGPNPKATLTVTYTVHWDDYDQRSRQLYSEGWKVIGADSACRRGRHGRHRHRPRRRGHRPFSSEGQASTEREIVIELDVDTLDEDPGSNADEIKVQVSLDPVGPFRGRGDQQPRSDRRLGPGRDPSHRSAGGRHLHEDLLRGGAGRPARAQVPAILVFHGGGQDAEVIARRWGIDPPAPVPVPLQDYLLVFPETHPGLAEQWVHRGPSRRRSAQPGPRLRRRAARRADHSPISNRFAAVPEVTADPALVYAAGFSNGGGLRLAAAQLRPVGCVPGLRRRRQGARSGEVSALPPPARGDGTEPLPAPVCYVHGTADRGYRPPFTLEEEQLDHTLPFFTLTEMVARNGLTAGPASTTLVPGSTGVTEVVLQLFTGAEAYLHGTVINGGHNWPTPTTRGNPPVADHFDATQTIVEFWQTHAGCPDGPQPGCAGAVIPAASVSAVTASRLRAASGKVPSTSVT